MTFYNTMTRRKEEFQPLEEGKVRMYNCGPTVYDFVHIGNCRSFLMADLLRRYLEYRGYEVTQIMNITDVGHMVGDRDQGEDKMEKSAREQEKDIWEIAGFYMDTFFEDIKALNFRKAHLYPRATEHIPEMIEMVKKLEELGYTYTISDGVYFEVEKFQDYGKLSGNTVERLDPGSRVKVNEEKKSPIDFTLWMRGDDFLMKWDSPWGAGRPGWHIECSAMSMKYLGESFDIHTGGEDNVFPHHENEIAQSEAATGKPFAKYWLHARYLLVDNQKMSKSLGNFYTLRDLLEKGCDAMQIRYALMSTHYRQPLNFTMEGLEAARHSIQRVRDFIAHLRGAAAEGNLSDDVKQLAEKTLARFEEGLDDDLNISVALAAIFDLIHEVNRLDINKADAEHVLSFMAKVDDVLGLQFLAEEESLDEEIERLIEERKQARANKDFARADEIRDGLLARGIILEDGPDGTRWKRR
ncbi:MAG: cysteine--tRNA ligase [Planctomycetes bacterium]|nr:cysteine--tRNA ligase [Planctomycetota bacterium]